MQPHHTCHVSILKMLNLYSESQISTDSLALHLPQPNHTVVASARKESLLVKLEGELVGSKWR